MGSKKSPQKVAPKKAEAEKPFKQVLLTCNANQALFERVEKLRALWQKDSHGVELSRSAVVRALILESLKKHEK
jgi:hypothetical protein